MRHLSVVNVKGSLPSHYLISSSQHAHVTTESLNPGLIQSPYQTLHSNTLILHSAWIKWLLDSTAQHHPKVQTQQDALSADGMP